MTVDALFTPSPRKLSAIWVICARNQGQSIPQKPKLVPLLPSPGRKAMSWQTLPFIPQACGLIIFWGQLSLDDREQPVSHDLSPSSQSGSNSVWAGVQLLHFVIFVFSTLSSQSPGAESHKESTVTSSRQPSLWPNENQVQSWISSSLRSWRLVSNHIK